MVTGDRSMGYKPHRGCVFGGGFTISDQLKEKSCFKLGGEWGVDEWTAATGSEVIGESL